MTLPRTVILLAGCCILVANCALRLSPTPSYLLSSTRACPGKISYHCRAQDSHSGQVKWLVNGDPVTSYQVSSNSSSSPISLPVSRRGSHIAANLSVQLEVLQSSPGSFGWRSTLEVNLLPGALVPRSNISCSDGSSTNSSTVNCQLPQVPPFLRSPANSSCDRGGNVTFSCLPPPSFSDVSWEVSSSRFIPAKNRSMMILYQLQLEGCGEEWRDVSVQCVGRRGDMKVYSQTARLSVNSFSGVKGFLIDEEQETFSFLVGLAVAVLLAMLCCVTCCCLGCLNSRKKNTKPLVQLPMSDVASSSLTMDGRRTSMQEDRMVSVQIEDSVGSRNEQRMAEIKTEKSTVLNVMRERLGNVAEEDLAECGSRLQKYYLNTVTSVAVKPTLCAINLALKEKSLTRFLEGLSHPHVQRICSIKQTHTQAEEESGRSLDLILVTQPVWGVSLRDMIHGESNPFQNWEFKYVANSGSPLPVDRVSLFGSQILQAVQYLYGQRFEGTSLKPLGQIQSGNIFVNRDHCKLGGYDNTLLGYRSTQYAKISQSGYLDYIDIIMFGYIIYEMAAGKDIADVLPNDLDYSSVADVRCSSLLRYIFTRKDHSKSFKHSIQDIAKQSFFKETSKPSGPGFLGRFMRPSHTEKHSFTKSLDAAEEERYLIRKDSDP